MPSRRPSTLIRPARMLTSRDAVECGADGPAGAGHQPTCRLTWSNWDRSTSSSQTSDHRVMQLCGDADPPRISIETNAGCVMRILPDPGLMAHTVSNSPHDYGAEIEAQGNCWPSSLLHVGCRSDGRGRCLGPTRGHTRRRWSREDSRIPAPVIGEVRGVGRHGRH